jgi:hypothetical protein
LGPVRSGLEAGNDLGPWLTNLAHFAEIRRIRNNPNSKIAEFIVYKFKKLKKSEKICKKLDEILRLLVKKFFQISII